MATRVERTRENLCEDDFYVSTERQAALLRNQEFDALGLDKLVEEVEALGQGGTKQGSEQRRAPNL